MTVTVKFFASLREEMGRGEQTVDPWEFGTVADVWSTVCGDNPLQEHVMAAVNQEYVDREHLVRDGDEVAFFPPVTGG